MFSKFRLGNGLFWLMLVFCTYYSSYRYPLQVNFSGTSPTYADTPFILQITKYGVVAIICIFAAWLIRFRRGYSISEIYPFLYFILFSIPIVRGIISGELNHIETSFWALSALVLVGATKFVSVRILSKYLSTLFFISLAVLSIQVALFLLTGRLPALGYEGSYSVRFGSFLDDPNGFAALCMLFLGWFWSSSERNRMAGIITTVICLLLTQSWTALGFLLLIASIAAFRRNGWAHLFPLFVLAALPIVIASILGIDLIEFAKLLYEIKRGSIDAHLGTGQTFELMATQILIGTSEELFYESWWVYSFLNHGFLWTIFAAVLMTYPAFVTFTKYQHSSHPVDKRVFFAIFLFQLYFLLGSFNLPFIFVFPVNFLFFAFSLAIVTGKVHAFQKD